MIIVINNKTNIKKMKEYVMIYIKTKKSTATHVGFGNKLNITSTLNTTSAKQPYISTASLCFAFTLAIYTYAGLLCGSGV